MSAPRRFRVLFGLIAGQACLHASMAGLRMAASLRVLRAGHGEYAVGALLALFSVAPIALALWAGRLADRRGYHAPLRLAVALTVTGASLAWASTRLSGAEYPVLCLAALLSGAGASTGLITIQRSAGRSAGDATEMKRVFSWLGVAPSLSNSVGPLAAGLVIDAAGFGAAFALLACMPLLSLGCARWVPHEVPQALPEREPRKGAAWDLLSTPMLRRLLLVNWFMSTSWDLHGFLVPVLGNQRGLSASAIGSVLGTLAVAVTLVRLVIPLLAHRLSEAQVLSGAMATVAAVFALYPLASSAWQMGVCASVLGLALGCSQPMIMTALHQITPARRHGEAIALRSMAINLSSTLMPLSFGLVGSALGAAGLFWSMGGLVALGALIARSLDTAPRPADGG
jgi:predicted MFS family arabinose efflux permease